MVGWCNGIGTGSPYLELPHPRALPQPHVRQAQRVAGEVVVYVGHDDLPLHRWLGAGFCGFELCIGLGLIARDGSPTYISLTFNTPPCARIAASSAARACGSFCARGNFCSTSIWSLVLGVDAASGGCVG